jgi:vibriolysin
MKKKERRDMIPHSLSRAAAVLALGLVACAGAATAAPSRSEVPVLTPAQQAGLDALPAIETALTAAQAVPTFVKGRLGTYDPAGGARSAAGLLTTLGPALRAGVREELRQKSARADDLGTTHVRLQQYVDGLPVVGGELVVHIDTATTEIYLVSGRFLPAGDLPTTPAIDAHRAVEAFLAQGEGRRVLAEPVEEELELVYAFGPEGRGHLAWAGTLAYTDAQGDPQIDRFFVDALDARVVERHPLIHRALDREVWDAQNTTDKDGRVRLIDEGGSSTDLTAQRAYDFTGDAWDYFKARHGWDSYNNAGGLIHSTVHYDTNYNNAFWNGSDKLLVFGDGNGTSWGPFARALDVVAHELTHGVTQYAAGLVYSNESGALNEAMSDIFGAAVEARERGLSANTWLLAEDVFTPGTPGDALRYMNNPTLDGSSKDYYPERYTGTSDNGGVHWNSGIANLAFYLLSQGGMHPRGKTAVNVRSIGLNSAERIFFRALRDYMGSGETFAQARQHTAQAAVDLFGHNSQAHRAVCEAWDAVGVPGQRTGVCLTAGDGPTPPASVDAFSWLCYGWYDLSWSAVSGATRYEVYASPYRDDFGLAPRIYSGAATSTSYNFGSSSYVRVKTCNAGGCGPYSLAYDYAQRHSICY